jgi:hypothetical protein
MRGHGRPGPRWSHAYTEALPHPRPAAGLARTIEQLRPRPDHGEDSWTGRDRLTGKRALITAVTPGIGRAIAIAFAKEGAAVAITHLPEEADDAASTAEVIRALGGTCHLFEADLRTHEEKRAGGEGGRGRPRGPRRARPQRRLPMTHGELAEFPADQIERTFQTNGSPRSGSARPSRRSWRRAGPSS